MQQASKKILVVEDEASLAQVLASELRDAGFSVLVATNGKDGLAVALRHHPDLIVADVVMPRMDGLTMLAQLRQDAWGKQVPVLMLTNVSNAAKIDESFNRGVQEYIVKADWQLKDIVTKVKRKLSVPAAQ